ncbi:hypothetical protein [Stenotrophomonas terrae]|uniref:hypothetical protein n=1 Tax=Stenotrophomonas terrae TaxID=405446 RepID=UPI000AEF8116|nr:hypothetical protein [Stenotrophomonas terrae]
MKTDASDAGIGFLFCGSGVSREADAPTDRQGTKACSNVSFAADAAPTRNCWDAARLTSTDIGVEAALGYHRAHA